MLKLDIKSYAIIGLLLIAVMAWGGIKAFAGDFYAPQTIEQEIGSSGKCKVYLLTQNQLGKYPDLSAQEIIKKESVKIKEVRACESVMYKHN